MLPRSSLTTLNQQNLANLDDFLNLVFPGPLAARRADLFRHIVADAFDVLVTFCGMLGGVEAVFRFIITDGVFRRRIVLRRRVTF